MHYHHDPRKMPSMRTLLIPEPGERRRQSSADQLAVVKGIAAAFAATGRSRKRKAK